MSRRVAAVARPHQGDARAGPRKAGARGSEADVRPQKGVPSVDYGSVAPAPQSISTPLSSSFSASSHAPMNRKRRSGVDLHMVVHAPVRSASASAALGSAGAGADASGSGSFRMSDSAPLTIQPHAPSSPSSRNKRAKVPVDTPSAAVTLGLSKVFFGSPVVGPSAAGLASSTQQSSLHSSQASMQSSYALSSSMESSLKVSASSAASLYAPHPHPSLSAPLSPIPSSHPSTPAFCSLGVPSPSPCSPTPRTTDSTALAIQTPLPESPEEEEDEDDMSESEVDEEDEDDMEEMAGEIIEADMVQQLQQEQEPEMEEHKAAVADNAHAAAALPPHHLASYSQHDQHQLDRSHIAAEARRRALAEERAEEAEAAKYACEESLEEDQVAPLRGAAAMELDGYGSPMPMHRSASAARAADPVESVSPTSSHAAELTYIVRERFGLPPSTYRSYHSRLALIVSVERSLEAPDADIEDHMWASEQRYHPYPYYIHYQHMLEANMRPVLLSWLMEVAGEYCLARETVHLAFNYVDRFLTLSPPHPSASAALQEDGQPDEELVLAPALGGTVDRTTLQLLGVTSLFLAAKVEEIHPPTAEDMAETTMEACTPQQIFQMERAMLQVLDWKLHPQTPVSWLKLFLKKACLGLYQEFKTRAAELMRLAEAGTEACVAAAAAAAAAASSADATAAAAAPSAFGPSIPPSTHHAAQQQFSTLQLSFLQHLESLLSANMFVRLMEHLDAFCLDMHSLRFYPSQLAAAVLFLYHNPRSSMHHLIAAATGYSYDTLLPAIELLALFTEMPFVGLPGDAAKLFGANLNIPYDEMWSRQVHHPDALDTLQAIQPHLGEIAHAHTNVLRSIPEFLPESTYADMVRGALLVPLKNNHCHLTDPTLWNNDPTATHLGPTPEEQAAALAAAHAALDESAANALVHAQAVRSSAEAALPHGIMPEQDVFLAAAAMPYTRLPANAVHAGTAAKLRAAKAKAAAAAAAPSTAVVRGGVVFTSSSSAAAVAARAAAGSSSTTVYTFGESDPMMHAGASARAAAAAAAPLLPASSGWDDSDDEFEEAA